VNASAPKVNVELKRFGKDVELANAAATEWLQQLELKRFKSVALSGGRIAKSFFLLTSARAQNNLALFRDVDFFWADERCVDPSNPESNFYMADENLFRPLKINPAKVHRLYGELEPESAVDNANAAIRRIVPPNANDMPVLDLVILGMGEDGHVASLFPNTPKDVSSTTNPYLHVWNSPKPPVHRLSLSYAALAVAKYVWVLASGQGKEEALRESLAENGKTPLARVLQSRMHTKVFTDIAL
jgi:6-phosphogluconolactonase